MIEYLLNCSIYYYSKTDGCHVLFSSEKHSSNLKELENLIGQFNGIEYTNGEYEPIEPCIKFSASICYIDQDEGLQIITERYSLINLKDYNSGFWNIADKLTTYIH